MARLVLVLAASILLLPAPAAARERPAPVAEVGAGALLFADDGVVTEGFVGGTVRFFLSPRVSIGPEVAFVSATGHSHLMLTGNVTFDLVAPAGAELPRATPFFVVGGGVFQTREQFPNETFTSADPAFTAGGGVRARLGSRVSAGAELRVGWELHVRVNGLVAVRLGG